MLNIAAAMRFLLLLSFAVAAAGQSLGQRLPAPLVLQGSQYLENCHGDRAGIVGGFLTVSDGASAGRNFFRLASQGTFAALVVDADGNIFLQRANNQVFVLERGDGPQFTYTLELDDLGQLSLLNDKNELYFGTVGRDVPRACPVLGCDSVDSGDCEGCLSLPNGQSCAYCPNEGTCLASTRACTGEQGLFFRAQCVAPTTTTAPPSKVQPSLTPVPKGTAFTVRPPLTTTKPVTARPTVASGVTNGFVTRAADTNRPQFTVRPVTLPTLANQLFTSGPGDTDDDSSGGAADGTLETGAIVGIALGAFIVVCAVLLLMGFLIVRHIRATKRSAGHLSVPSAAYQHGAPWTFTSAPASTAFSAATPTQYIPTVGPVLSTRQIEPEPTAATQATFYGPSSETMQFYGSAQTQTPPAAARTMSNSTVRGTRGTGTQYGLTPTPKPDF